MTKMKSKKNDYIKSYFLELMLIRIPTAVIAVRRDEPPYERNSSGIPVIGIIPITIPTLIKK